MLVSLDLEVDSVKVPNLPFEGVNEAALASDLQVINISAPILQDMTLSFVKDYYCTYFLTLPHNLIFASHRV